jgi:anti-sigma factor (TIGR02949 family)
MTRIDRYTCEDTFRRLDDYLDRALTPEERAMVEEHLRNCEACAAEYRFEATIVGEVRGKLRRIMAPHELIDRIAARLAEAAQAGQQDSSPS